MKFKDGHEALKKMKRISKYEEYKYFNEDVFLLPDNIKYEYSSYDLIKVLGLDKHIDEKWRDLIRIIEITEKTTVEYKMTNVITPLLYAEFLVDKLWHINTQGIIFIKLDKEAIEWIKCTDSHNEYGKHIMDKFWLPCCKNIEEIAEDDIVCIFNRRVGGWDGSYERPVIELLGAGGHLPTIWNENEQIFKQLTIKDNLSKEIGEELGVKICSNDITILGKYLNELTHEVVYISAIVIETRELKELYKYAVQNIDEDTQGIYMGYFDEVIQYYIKSPEYFAGGKESLYTNFQQNSFIMNKIYDFINNM